MKKMLRGKDCVIFFDFDNTITMRDTLDDIVARFSPGDEWIGLERRWIAGKIGSRQCLQGQMRGLRVTKKRLTSHLKTIKIDPSFRKILKFCAARGIKKYILSDNFEYILKKVLSDKGIRGLRVYCNRLIFSGDRAIPSFPFLSADCGKCAHCKKSNLVANSGKDAVTIYVGDGLSDVCPAKAADIVFAKGRLKQYCKESGIGHIPFKNLGEVYECIQEMTS